LTHLSARRLHFPTTGISKPNKAPGGALLRRGVDTDLLRMRSISTASQLLHT
jgi:hypothetical protein